MSNKIMYDKENEMVVIEPENGEEIRITKEYIFDVLGCDDSKRAKEATDQMKEELNDKAKAFKKAIMENKSCEEAFDILNKESLLEDINKLYEKFKNNSDRQELKESLNLVSRMIDKLEEIDKTRLQRQEIKND